MREPGQIRRRAPVAAMVGLGGSLATLQREDTFDDAALILGIELTLHIAIVVVAGLAGVQRVLDTTNRPH